MIEVLKKEFLVGKSYEVIFDGVRSLVYGLGSFFKVLLYMVRLYGISERG